MPNKSPLVTVVTPTFNRERWLPETIESILAQSYPRVEYLLLDDGSTDNTAALAKTYGDCVKYTYHTNRGENATLNVGWRMAHGDYFAMVSSDDLMQSNWLSKTISFMEENPDVLVAYPDWNVIDEYSRTVQRVTTLDYSMVDMVSWFHCFPGPGAVIRRSSVPDVQILRDESLYFASDMLMWFHLTLHGKFARIPESLATWRKHQGSITVGGQKLEQALEQLKVLEQFYKCERMAKEIAELKPISKSRAYAVASVLTRYTHPFRSYYFKLRSKALKDWSCESLPAELNFPLIEFEELVKHLWRGESGGLQSSTS